MNSSPFKRITESNKDIILIPKSEKYKYVFIFLHGLFATPYNFVDIFDKNEGPLPDSFKIILPCAPIQKADFNKGNPTTSWFNISTKYNGVIFEDTIDFIQFEKSSEKIKNIINNESQFLNGNYNHIFIGGFSQGACLAFHIGLTFNFLLGGISCFCGTIFDYSQIKENNKKNLNIFVALGGKDGFFQLNYALAQIKKNIQGNNNLIIKEYPNNSHNVCDDEIRDMKIFISNIINK